MSSSATFLLPALPAPSAPVPSGAGARPVTALRTFRDAIRELSPPWLRGPVLGKTMYALGALFDEMQANLVAGVKLRFPGLYTYESLPLLGRERRIRRGRLETEAVYASRMLPWLDHHRLRGGPYALLEQLHAHFAPANFAIVLRYTSSRRFSMDVAGTVTRDDSAWSPPHGTTRWARWWLFYDWPEPLDTDGLWGDPGTWTDGGVWGSNLSPTEVRDLRMVPREWNAQHAVGFLVLDSPLETITIAVEGA
jgi:hypothetical protein